MLRDVVCPGCRRLLEECDPALPSSVVSAPVGTGTDGVAGGSSPATSSSITTSTTAGYLPWGMEERARQRSALISQYLLDSDDEV